MKHIIGLYITYIGTINNDDLINFNDLDCRQGHRPE